ncbi:hypothetical protein MSAN_00658800 [Mycena sanguinolenta]|uniref:F-box domain-containing protein n=1 Tax=Mycena sanguinolenta TaxID=230812 RepID=A0A8H6Z088_9AGAR|nr:hypothetical protein MSAN_00658800 [Mycena sanguinolenta]
MGPNLPVDVVYVILGHLDTEDSIDRQTLGACGLVCTEWTHPSRYYLFREVYLSDSNLELLLDLIETSPYHIISFVHLLVLSSAVVGGLLDQSIAKLGPLRLPNASDLLTCIPCDIFARHSSGLAQICPNLVRLTFAINTLPLERIFEVARFFPSVGSICFRHCGFDHVQPPKNPLPVQRHALALDMDRFFMQKFCHHVLPLRPIPVVSSLRLSGLLPEPTSAAGNYLRQVGVNLHYLEFCAQPGFSDDALKYCTGLRHLVIRIYSISAEMLCFRILPHLRCPNLTTLTFGEIAPTSYLCSAEPLEKWRTVDEFLTHEHFPNLCTFTIASPWLFTQQLRHCMPLSVARGMLHVIGVRLTG